MSPRTGRPPIENPKSVKMNIRISEETAKNLQKCAETLKISRVNVIEKGIQLVKAEIEKITVPPSRGKLSETVTTPPPEGLANLLCHTSREKSRRYEKC